MSDQLTNYFEQYAEHGIEQMKKAMLGIGFYERVIERLAAKDDLSDELPVIGKIGPKSALAVAKQALEENKQAIEKAWELPEHLVKKGVHKVSVHKPESEMLPRAEVSYQFKSDAGLVKIKITTAGETYKLEIDAGRNPMAAQLAITSLEKHLMFAAFA